MKADVRFLTKNRYNVVKVQKVTKEGRNMRRKINKALAMLMAVAMTCSTVQLQAFAQTTKEQEQVITIEEQATEEKEAVESETINEA